MLNDCIWVLHFCYLTEKKSKIAHISARRWVEFLVAARLFVNVDNRWRCSRFMSKSDGFCLFSWFELKFGSPLSNYISKNISFFKIYYASLLILNRFEVIFFHLFKCTISEIVHEIYDIFGLRQLYDKVSLIYEWALN